VIGRARIRPVARWFWKLQNIVGCESVVEEEEEAESAFLMKIEPFCSRNYPVILISVVKDVTCFVNKQS
jgi:hypothetical protein